MIVPLLYVDGTPLPVAAAGVVLTRAVVVIRVVLLDNVLVEMAALDDEVVPQAVESSWQ